MHDDTNFKPKKSVRISPIRQFNAGWGCKEAAVILSIVVLVFALRKMLTPSLLQREQMDR